MPLTDFIEHHLKEILVEWERFAASLRPAAAGMSAEELRDLAEAILRSVLADMQQEQSERERHLKSVGDSPEQTTEVARTARGHAAERLSEGFTLNQLVAEYRALRASVVRQWRAQLEPQDEDQLEELTRFNEAIDQSMAEAVDWYNARIEDARDLLNGVLAHDLRNPLSAVLTSAESLLLDESLPARQTATAVRIRNSGTRMRRMIDDLLDFTRTRLGTGLPMEESSADMGAIVREVVAELRVFHPEANMVYEISGELGGIWDVSRLEQLLSNLISNAVEHDGGRAPVRISATARGEGVMVEVHNQGGPIPQEEQDVIFDPLRRGAARGEQQTSEARGVGLGLYIARQIAEAHDGTIEVESSADTGTTFTVRLPRRRNKGSATAGVT